MERAKIARGPGHIAEIQAAIGVPGPQIMSWLTIFVAVVGGLAVLLGVCAPVATVPMAAIPVVAGHCVRCSGTRYQRSSRLPMNAEVAVTMAMATEYHAAMNSGLSSGHVSA